VIHFFQFRQYNRNFHQTLPEINPSEEVHPNVGEIDFAQLSIVPTLFYARQK
jgi:hypothetical protein